MKTPKASLRAARRGGYTLVEIAVSAVILTVGVLGLVAAVTAADKLVAASRQTRAAFDAARSLCEDMQARPIAEAFAAYNATLADDPVAATAPGARFDVSGLAACKDDVDGRVGEILFPSPDGVVLREDTVDTALGMPRDLDGDGLVSNGPPAGDLLVLPVRVRVRWNGLRGPQFVEVHRVLLSMGGT